MEGNKIKNILVTGGAGFIGSHLCKTLLELRHNVICLDNLFTGSLDNISELLTNSNFEFVNHDIIEPFLEIKLMKYIIWHVLHHQFIINIIRLKLSKRVQLEL